MKAWFYRSSMKEYKTYIKKFQWEEIKKQVYVQVYCTVALQPKSIQMYQLCDRFWKPEIQMSTYLSF